MFLVVLTSEVGVDVGREAIQGVNVGTIQNTWKRIPNLYIIIRIEHTSLTLRGAVSVAPTEGGQLVLCRHSFFSCKPPSNKLGSLPRIVERVSIRAFKYHQIL